MFRKLTQTFSATHFVILAIAAMFIPGTLYAVVSYQPVAIVNANTGIKAAVDSQGRLYTYDPVADPLAGYARDPKNAVNIEFNLLSSPSCQSDTYPIPSGKALVITAISGGHIMTGSNGNTQNYLFDAPGCGGNLLDFETGNQTWAPIATSLGNGIVVSAGQTLTVNSFNDVGYLFVHGYLVPATAVPAPSSAEAAYQGRRVTAEAVRAKQASVNGR